MLESRHLAKRITLQEFILLMGALHERYFSELVGCRLFGQCKTRGADISAEIRAIDDRRGHDDLLTCCLWKIQASSRPASNKLSEIIRAPRFKDMSRECRWSSLCRGGRSCARARRQPHPFDRFRPTHAPPSGADCQECRT